MMSDQHKQLALAGVGVLGVGVILAGVIYWAASRPGDAASQAHQETPPEVKQAALEAAGALKEIEAQRVEEMRAEDQEYRRVLELERRASGRVLLAANLPDVLKSRASAVCPRGEVDVTLLLDGSLSLQEVVEQSARRYLRLSPCFQDLGLERGRRGFALTITLEGPLSTADTNRVVRNLWAFKRSIKPRWIESVAFLREGKPPLVLSGLLRLGEYKVQAELPRYYGKKK